MSFWAVKRLNYDENKPQNPRKIGPGKVPDPSRLFQFVVDPVTSIVDRSEAKPGRKRRPQLCMDWMGFRVCF